MIRVNAAWFAGVSKCLTLAKQSFELVRARQWQIDALPIAIDTLDEPAAKGEQLHRVVAQNVMATIELIEKLLTTVVGPSSDSSVADLFDAMNLSVSETDIEQLGYRQRKLFEILSTLTAIYSKNILQSGLTPLYLLHYKLCSDLEYIRLQQNDNEEFYRHKNAALESKRDLIQQKVDTLSSVIDQSFILWPRDSKSLYVAILKQNLATLTENVALGVTYQSVFGSASNTIHFNLTSHDSDLEGQLLSLIDRTTLLLCSVVSRMADVLKATKGISAPETELLKELLDAFIPGELLASKVFVAKKGDVVWINSVGPGVVVKFDDSTDWRHAAYEVQNPLDMTSDWYAARDITLITTEERLPDFLLNASKFIALPTTPLTSAEVCQVVNALNTNPLAWIYLHKLLDNQDVVRSLFLEIGRKISN